jgi:hypothetical protein
MSVVAIGGNPTTHRERFHLCKATGAVGYRDGGPDLVLDRVGGLLDIASDPEQRGASHMQGGLDTAGRFGRAFESQDNGGLGRDTLREGLPAPGLVRRRLYAIDEATVLQGRQGAKADHSLLELRRLVGGAGPQGLSHGFAAAEPAAEARGLLHIGREGACRGDHLPGQFDACGRGTVVGDRQAHPGGGT